ncbi:MAG: pyruvate kinase [Gammaproteobacteria bacterium]|nr:pyruvate kinase [Gammaproteobacteria bacterium]
MATDRLIQRTLAGLRELRDQALAFEVEHADAAEAVDPHHRNSARNLLHYLSVRQRDIRSLQQDLHSLGLSSLGVLESHVLATLNAVIANLEALAGQPQVEQPHPPVDARSGPLLLRDHARRLLGPTPRHRSVRIMVTMPGTAADDPRLIEDLLRAGMDLMRINCAHDDPATWRRMAEKLRAAEQVVGRSCAIQADLGGPKLRTGPLEALGHFVRIKPKRDATGRIMHPARVWLTPAGNPEAPPAGLSAVLPIASGPLRLLRSRDTLHVTDLRGRHRSLLVVERSGRSAIAQTDRTIYAATGERLEAVRDGELVGEFEIGDLPGITAPIPLSVGETLVLTRDATPGRPASRDATGRVIAPAHIHCTLPAAFARVRVGDRVWLDDGKIGGSVRSNDGARIEMEVTQVPPAGGRLRAEKGINFPDTELGLDALTDKDLDDLREATRFADIVALSFVRNPQDVLTLAQKLREFGAGHLGIILKIENATAFRNLPRILLAGLRTAPVGVMVARGDLAVEVGFERLSEVQEEILWLCEAAHVPVVWATQVLEGLAKGGAPTRAEVSDAVMSSRAECVMLNKGPKVVSTVEFLADILERMEEHHDKRMALLRRLSVSEI